MTEKESVMAFMKLLTNQADLETIMSLIFEAVEISGDEINRFGYFTLEALLEYANPYLLSYVQKLKKPMRKKVEEEFRKAVFVGKFNPLRPKGTDNGVNYYFFDD